MRPAPDAPAKKKRKKYNLSTQHGPRGDAPQTRKEDFAKAEKFKRTPQYRSAVKQAYKSQPVEQRQQRVAKALNKVSGPRRLSGRNARRLSIEDRAILDTAFRRAARDELLLRSRGYSDRARKIVEGYKSRPFYLDQLADARALRTPGNETGDKHNDVLFETDPDKLRRAGFKPEGLGDKLAKAPLGMLVSGAAFGEAVYHDPITTPGRTAKQLLTALPAMPAAAVSAVTQPLKTAEEMAAGIAERSTQPYRERVETIRREGGLDYLSDATIAAAPVSGTAGMSARLLRRAPRAVERTSGGTTRARPEHEGIGRYALGNARDRLRARRAERRLQEAEAGGAPIDALELQAALANRAAGRVVEVPATGRRATRAQRQAVAKARSRGVYRLRAEQGRRVAVARKTINKLDRRERKALYYAATFGIRSAQHAREHLPKLAESIRETRRAEGIQVTGSLRKSDMLPEIAELLSAPERHFTAKLAEVLDELRPESLRAGRNDPSLSTRTRLTRRHADQAALLGIERLPDETDSSFVARVQDAAAELELVSPLYFRSERYAAQPGFADFAVGGRRAMRRDQRHEGRNLAQGLQDTAPEQYLRGLARNIKRTRNWNLVADILEANALREFSPPGGAKLAVLRERLVAAGVDLNSVAFWDAGAYRARAQERHNTTTDDRFEDAEEFEASNARAAMIGSIVRATDGDLTDALGNPLPAGTLESTRRWYVVPKAALRELEDQTTPSGAAGRSLDIAKGKASRAMLLAANIPWLGVQTASNVAMTAAATGGRALNPANWVGAAKWWRGLTPEERENVGSVLGVDATSADTRQIKLGAASNHAMVNAYRALKAHPMWHTGIAKGRGPSVSQLNPLELMAMADRGQNNLTRVLAGYTLAKRDAVRAMGRDMGLVDRTQARIASVLALPPHEQLRALANDPDVLERHADHVADWMGDYTTMTARERKTIGRAVMFYPYLRYSLKLVFYTMPTQHPSVMAVLAELAEMRAEELREIFGDEQLPWQLGRIYYGEDGDVKSIDLTRANPALNAVVSAASAAADRDNAGQIAGLLPPYATALLNQGVSRDLYAGRDWRLQSSAPRFGQTVPMGALEERGRVFLQDMASILYPYRFLANMEVNPTTMREDERLHGTQGDDSLIWSPRPTRYRGDDAISKLKAAESGRQERFEERHESFIRELVPLLPQPSRDANAAKIEKAIARIEKQKPKRRKAKPYGIGAGAGSGKPFGAK